MLKYSDFIPLLVGTWFGGYLEDVYGSMKEGRKLGEFNIPISAKATKRVKELIPFLHGLCENKGYEGEKVWWPTLVKQPGLYRVLGEDVFIYIEVIGDPWEEDDEFLGTPTNEDKAMWIWGCGDDYYKGNPKGYMGEIVPGAEFLKNRLNNMAELDTFPWAKKWISFKISGGEGGGESPDFGLEDLQFLHIQRFLDWLPHYPPLNWTIPQVKNLLERVI